MILNKLRINLAWQVLEKAVKSLMTLAVGTMVIRHLGPNDYGQMAYVISLVLIFQTFSSLGIDGILIREIIFKQNTPNVYTNETNSDFLKSEKTIIKEADIYNIKVAEVISTALMLRLSAGFVSLFGCLLYLGLKTNWNTNYLLLALFLGSGLIIQASDAIDLWNQSQSNSKRTSVIKIIVYVVSSLFRIYLVKTNAGLLWFAFATFVEVTSIGSILYILHSRKLYFIFSIKIDKFKNIACNLIKETWPLLFSAVLAATYSRFDQIILEQYYGTAQLGIYNASILFATATYFIPIVICSSVMPFISEAKKRSQTDYIKMLRVTYIAILMTALTVVTVTFVSTDLIVKTFLGERFGDSSYIIRAYSITNIPVYLGIAHGLWMVNESKLRMAIYKGIVGASMSVSLSLILIPHYGIKGALITIISSLVMSDILTPIFLNKGLFWQIINVKN